MLLYTSLSTDIFDILLSLLQKKQPLNYYSGRCFDMNTWWLITVMKHRLQHHDRGLANRSAASNSTSSKVVNTPICAMHEMLYKPWRLQSGCQATKCQGSMPKILHLHVYLRIALKFRNIHHQVRVEISRSPMSLSPVWFRLSGVYLITTSQGEQQRANLSWHTSSLFSAAQRCFI